MPSREEKELKHEYVEWKKQADLKIDKKAYMDSIFEGTSKAVCNRLKKYECKINTYLKDESKYGLSYCPAENEKITLLDWYAFIGNDLKETNEMISREDAIEIGRKRCSRLKDTLQKVMCIEVGDLNGDDKLEKIKFLTFLYRYSVDEGINYKSLFSIPSLENAEYLYGEELTPHNADIMTVFYEVIAAKVNPEKNMELHSVLIEMEMEKYRFEDFLGEYTEDLFSNVETLNKIKKVIMTTTQKYPVPEMHTADTLYDRMLVFLAGYQLICENAEMIKLYDYLKDIQYTIRGLNPGASLVLRMKEVPRDGIVVVAYELRNELSQILGIPLKTYDGIVKNLLGKYIDLLDTQDSVMVLHILIIIDEIANQLKGKLEKKTGTFYRSKTADKQKTFLSVVKSGEGSILMNNILTERLNVIFSDYVGKKDVYMGKCEILKIICENTIAVFRKGISNDTKRENAYRGVGIEELREISNINKRIYSRAYGYLIEDLEKKK